MMRLKILILLDMLTLQLPEDPNINLFKYLDSIWEFS